MAVMVPREKWTDERLDDLNKRVDDGFAETKAEMRQGFVRVDGEIQRLDGDIKELRREMNLRFEAMSEAVNSRFDALNRNLIGGLFVVIATVIGSNTL